MASESIVAIRLQTKADLVMLGWALEEAWPVDDTAAFSALLAAIDEAERELRRRRNRKSPKLTLVYSSPQTAE